MRTVSPEDRYVAWVRFNTHDGRSATTLHLCDSDAPGAFRVYRWEDVQDGAAREIKRLTAALERIRTGIAHDRCDGDSEFAAGVSAACRNHLELVNAAVAYGVKTGEPRGPVHSCKNCAHLAKDSCDDPCAGCTVRWRSGVSDRWEPALGVKTGGGTDGR